MINQNMISEYSEDEKIIGKWIDGRPVYRKVFHGNGNNAKGANVQFSVNDLNISFLVDIYGNAKVAGDGYFRPFSSISVGAPNDSVDAYINLYGNTVTVRSGSSLALNEFYVIIEYVKTTD